MNKNQAAWKHLQNKKPGTVTSHEDIFCAGYDRGVHDVIYLLEDSRGGVWEPELAEILREVFDGKKTR